MRTSNESLDENIPERNPPAQESMDLEGGEMQAGEGNEGVHQGFRETSPTLGVEVESAGEGWRDLRTKSGMRSESQGGNGSGDNPLGRRR